MLNFYQVEESSSFVNSMFHYSLKSRLKPLKPRIKRRNNSYYRYRILFSSASRSPTTGEHIVKGIAQRFNCLIKWCDYKQTSAFLRWKAHDIVLHFLYIE